MLSRTLSLLLLLALLISTPLHAQWTVTNDLLLFNPDTFNGIACADSLNCIAYGYAAYDYIRLKKSTDGGRTWQWLLNEQADLSGGTYVLPLRPFSAAYPTPVLMLISTNNQRMLRSTDAGSTWDTVLFSDIPNSWYGGKLRMFDANNGLLVYGAALHVYSTSDGGATWIPTEARPLPLERRAYTSTIFSPTRFNILAFNGAGDSSWLYRTDDGGMTWSNSLLPDSAPYNFADFSDPLHGWVVGGIRTGVGDLERDVIARTTDGGLTWTRVLDTLIQSVEAPTPWGLFGMDAYDANNVLVVGHRGKILRTRDGGITWRAENSGIKVTGGPNDWYMGLLRAVRFTSATTAIAAGWESAIIRFDETSSSVAARADRAAMIVAPNPVTSICTVHLPSGAARRGNLSLIDGLGRIAKRLDAAESPATGDGGVSVTIDMSDLPDGIYMIDVDGYAIEKVVKVSR